MCRATISLYTTVLVGTDAPLKKPKPFYGHCVYLQGGSPGVASYHFDSPDDCYISYENAPAEWKTADGSPFPVKKAFENPTYDPLTRTFTGTIDWSPKKVDSDIVRWEYRLVFSDSLNVIMDGEIKQYNADGNKVSTKSFPDDLIYWRNLRAATENASLFGLTYIQHGHIGVASYHFVREGEAYISYKHAPEQWRLDDGTSPPLQKPFIDPHYNTETRTFTGQIEWAPMTFGGDARWEYTMIFSPDMNKIVDGMVKTFKPDGSAGCDMEFGTSFSVGLSPIKLIYERYDEAKAEMISLLRKHQFSRR